MFLVDERAEGVSGSEITALVAKAMLERYPGSTVVHNLICSWAVPEVIRENGGTPVRARVGHSFIKQVMAETGAVFGGEHSGHYYFRDNYRADSGLIAAVVALEALSLAGRPLSEVLAPFRRYHASGEINSRVDDQTAKIEELAAAYRDGKLDRTDGLTVEFDDWWFNVRPSNTEPLLRLNVEARTAELLGNGPRRPSPSSEAKEVRREPGPRAARDPRLPERPRRGGVSGGRAGHRVRYVRLPVPRPRRHPRDAHRRGGEAHREEAAVTSLDDERTLLAGDPSGMLRAVASLPRQCAEGYRLAISAPDLPTAEGVQNVAVCGMGGSAVAGDVLRALAATRIGVPVQVVRSPELPEWCQPHARRRLQLLGGHGRDARVPRGGGPARVQGRGRDVGGEVRRLAEELGLGRVVVPGGLQPRAAVGLLTLGTIGAVEAAGLLPAMRGDVDECVRELEVLVDRLAPGVPATINLAKQVAEAVGESVPVMWGAEGLGAVAAARWKTQMNENAKVPAFASSLLSWITTRSWGGRRTGDTGISWWRCGTTASTRTWRRGSSSRRGSPTTRAHGRSRCGRTVARPSRVCSRSSSLGTSPRRTWGSRAAWTRRRSTRSAG